MTIARSLLYALANLLHPRMLWLIVWPMLIGQGATYIGINLARALASWLPGGSLSALSYAVRVNDISMGVIGTAMATTRDR